MCNAQNASGFVPLIEVYIHSILPFYLMLHKFVGRQVQVSNLKFAQLKILDFLLSYCNYKITSDIEVITLNCL